MRIAAIALLVLAIACEAFCYWGLNTVSGRHSFDEMAGIIPLVAGPVGAVLAVSSGVLWWLHRRRQSR